MRQSEIKIVVTLDDNKVAEKIEWFADDKPETQEQEDTRAFSLSLWDHAKRSTLQIDLWTKEMLVDDMKRMAIDTISSLSQSVLNATKDEVMAKEMDDLVEKLIKHVSSTAQS